VRRGTPSVNAAGYVTYWCCFFSDKISWC